MLNDDEVLATIEKTRRYTSSALHINIGGNYARRRKQNRLISIHQVQMLKLN